MPQIMIALVAFFFAGMGLAGLVSPGWLLGLFGHKELTLDGRNEVRAAYGGFGLAVAGALIAAMFGVPELRAGILIAFSVSLAGMALGRVVSLAIDREMSRFTVLVLTGELVMAGLLFGAYRMGAAA